MWRKGGKMTIDDKYKKINFEKFRSIFLYLTLGLIIITVAFELIGFFFNIPDFIELFKFLFSTCFATLASFFACHSIVLSRESSNIATSSDKKMQSISTADFYEITYRFWDRAPTLYRKQSYGVRDTYSWQLGNLFRHGEKLKNWADPDVQEKLIKEFKIFLTRLRPIPCSKYWGEIKNYIQICKIAIDFKTENDDIKNELIDELGEWIGKKEKEELNQEYLQRKSNEFSERKDSEIFEIIREKDKEVKKVIK